MDLTSTVLLKKIIIIINKKNQSRTNKTSTSTNEALTFEPILGEFGACRGAGDVITYHIMSNILKTKAAQMKLSAAQTSTSEAQTNETIRGEFGAFGLSDLRMTFKNIFYI